MLDQNDIIIIFVYGSFSSFQLVEKRVSHWSLAENGV